MVEQVSGMSARLRARAARILRQLDAAGGYRDQIDKEIEKRIGPAAKPAGDARAPLTSCHSCGTANDADARFCKSCGSAMEGAPS